MNIISTKDNRNINQHRENTIVSKQACPKRRKDDPDKLRRRVGCLLSYAGRCESLLQRVNNRAQKIMGISRTEKGDKKSTPK